MQTEYLIAGAGCAGLSMAVHLLEAGVTESITLIEPREAFQCDRTWCYWDLKPHPFEALVSYRWHRWALFDEEGQERIQESDIAYCHIHASDFYDAALARIAEAPQVRLLLGHEVISIEQHEEQVLVTTSAGSFQASWVFDSRPYHEKTSSPSLPGQVELLQHFWGCVVRFEEDCFDPETITLMDFQVEQSEGSRFMYVLPYTKCEALIENTYISSIPQTRAFYEERLKSYIRERWGDVPYQLLYEEKGVIPMRTAPVLLPGQRVIPIGLRGGLSKPSTGYAFLAIQTFSQQLVEQLISGQLPHYIPLRTPWQTFLDRVFLSYINTFPERMPGLMTRLFCRVGSSSLVRFLSDRGSFMDQLKVIWAMPKASFLLHMLRSFRVWLQPRTRVMKKQERKQEGLHESQLPSIQ